MASGGQREAADPRERHLHSTDKRLWYDPAIELATERPAVALAEQLSMRELLAALAPSPQLRLSTLSFSVPFPHPREPATSLDRTLGRLAPVHALGLDVLQPLSWVTPLPASRYKRALAMSAAAGAAGSPDGGNAPPPFAHVLIARGIGSHSITSTGSYTSSRDAYGRVLDSYLGRSACRTAAHAVMRTPLPIPITFPGVFPSHTYDAVGAYVGAAAGGARRPPPAVTDDAAATVAAAAAAGHATGGVPLPFSVPAFVYASTGADYAPALRRVHADFAGRDRSMAHRFGFLDRTSGSAGLDTEGVENALAGLADDYAEPGRAASGIAAGADMGTY
jgi:hypothetical protein